MATPTPQKEPPAPMSPVEKLRRESCWLLSHARNVASQHGEDGILEKALDVLPERDGWCVEFGAWDGKHLSTTWNLINHRGYQGVLIEGDPSKFRELLATYDGNARVVPIKRMVSLDGENSLDVILSATRIPYKFDFLSIDVDGNDYHIWDSLKHYHPKLVSIEFNASIPNEVDFVQPPDFSISQGNSIRALVRLAKDKGYELIAATRSNAIFVDQQLFSRFNIPDNSIEIMRNDFFRITYSFTGFDGTLLFRGHQVLPWHGIPIDEERLQLLPSFLRTFPDKYNPFQRRLLTWLLRWRQFLQRRTGAESSNHRSQ